MNVLDQYGIKEVSDVTFYTIEQDGTEVPVLFLDTLKVSTIEQSATQTEARGGKGNSTLIIWDYGKEINVNLEDALFSMQSLAMLYSNDKALKMSDSGAPVTIYLNEEVVTGETGKITLTKTTNAKAKNVKAIDMETGKSAEVTGSDATLAIGEEQGKTFRVFYTVDVDTKDQAMEITISAETFPGTYKIVGDTYARNRNTGKDEYFQFIIPRAKMGSEVTLTMEAKIKALGLLKLCELLEAVA